MRLCVRREYCVRDIEKKAEALLKDDTVDTGNAVGRVVAELVKQRFVDDSRYAGAYAREKAHISGWGAVKIRQALRMKGVDDEVIADALESLDNDKVELKAQRVVETKLRQVKDDPKCKMKLLSFAMGRGYSYDFIVPIINRCLKNLNED